MVTKVVILLELLMLNCLKHVTPAQIIWLSIVNIILHNYYENERGQNTHSKGEQVKIPLLLYKVGKRSGTMVTTRPFPIRGYLIVLWRPFSCVDKHKEVLFLQTSVLTGPLATNSPKNIDYQIWAKKNDYLICQIFRRWISKSFLR